MQKYNANIYKMSLALLSIIILGFQMKMILAGDNVLHLNVSKVLFTNNEQNLSYPPHILTYPLYHLTVKIVAWLLGGQYEMAGALVLMLSSIESICIVRFIVNRYLQSDQFYYKYLVDVISICFIFFEVLRSPLTNWRFYQAQGGPNPWHNPTIIFVRPFGLITYYCFILLLDKIRKKETLKKELFQFGIWSFLMTIAKPSFTMVLIPAAGIVILLYWIKDIKGNFLNAMKVFLSVCPTILLIIFQFVYMYFFNQGTPIPVKFKPGSYWGFSFFEVLCVSVAAFPVPLLTFALCDKKMLLKDEYILLSYLTLIISWLQFFLLTNGSSGDFSWGYDLAVGLSTIVSLSYLLKNYHNTWKEYLIFGVFILQVICGIHYFYLINLNGCSSYWF